MAACSRFVRCVATLVVLLMVSTMAGCAGGQKAEGPKLVKIGIAQPITGSCAFDGQQSRDGAILAEEHFRAEGRLSGYKVELLIEDDKSDPKEAAAIANKFAGDTNLVAVIGNYNSSCTLAAAPILGKAGIPQISTGSSSPKITGFSKYLFRTQPTDRNVGENIVTWAAELGFKRAAVIYENSDFGKGLQGVYEELWPHEGRQIVATDSYLAGTTTDFTPILTKVQKSGADVVLLGSLYNEAALMGKQAGQVGLRIPFFGDTSQHTDALLTLGKEGVEGWRVIGCLDKTSRDPLALKFFNDFKKKFGHEPNSFAAQAYDAMLLVLTGIEKNGPDREKIQQYLYTVKDFPGVTGKLTFKNGDVDKKLFRFVVQNAQFMAVER